MKKPSYIKFTSPEDFLRAKKQRKAEAAERRKANALGDWLSPDSGTAAPHVEGASFDDAEAWDSDWPTPLSAPRDEFGVITLQRLPRSHPDFGKHAQPHSPSLDLDPNELAESFTDAPDNDDVHSWRFPESTQLLKELLDPYLEKLGRAGLRRLRLEAEEALGRAEQFYDPTKGTFRAYAGTILTNVSKAFFSRFKLKDLERERLDQDLRDQARQGPAQLEAYLAHALKRIRDHQKHFPALWRVYGDEPKEVAATILAALAEGALKTEVDASTHLKALTEDEVLEGQRARRRSKKVSLFPDQADERPGREATIVFATRLRKRAYRAAMKKKALAQEFVQCAHTEPTPTPEDLLILAQETADEVTEQNPVLAAFETGKSQLTRIQRQWLDAIQADIAAHGELNLTRAGMRMPKPRSRAAASRAWATIRKILSAAGTSANDDTEK